ncbi:Retrovirus-related Pol polyprotein from transposon TNT 1-94 [Senna tora]|uniref:Retrovirus-related Pol polyprotein from transposon TNT 1-94 n=1 Tax=Senna tora TaxID=362788 RepID=A0A834TGN0_9FABA|nr:Retrovirus-related Pol polyprotein from transposon TNT 1-94 [Senna tora]
MATSSSTDLTPQEKHDQSTQQVKNPTWTLTSADQPGIPLVTSTLGGSNYIAWSIAFCTALEAKQKIAFIDGTIKKPSDPEAFLKWKPIDSMVKSWLTSSISKEISESLIHCDNALTLWKELEERFGTSCGPQLYHVQREMVTTEQGSDSITQYWNRLHRWWDEWARISPNPRCYCGKCTCEVNKRLEDKESSSRLMQFLMGLNQTFDALRGQVLNLDPMPIVNKAYNMAIQLERQREVNLNYGGGTSKEGAEITMMAKGPRNEGTKRRETKEEGYPEWYKELKKKISNNKKGVNVAATVGETPLEDVDGDKTEPCNQMSVLSLLVKELSKAMKGGTNECVNFAQLGNFAGNMHHSSVSYKDLWIIDTGASSHICFQKFMMHDIKTLLKPLKVHLPTGYTIDVHEVGSVTLRPGITLINVFLIPSFKYNLISVSRLAKEANVFVTFDSQYCFIQAQKTKEVLAKGKVNGNLYFLDPVENRKEKGLDQQCNSVTLPKTCTWHNRLGHCPFPVLEQIETIKLNKEDFPSTCDVCHYAKQQRTSFNKSLTRSECIFDLLHVDLWGPYKEKCIFTNAIYFLTIVDDHSRTTWVFLVQHKHLVPQLLDNFITMAQTQYNKAVKAIRTDRGYATGFKAYKAYDIENKKLYISRDIVFYEEIFPFQGNDQSPNSMLPKGVPVSNDNDAPEIVLIHIRKRLKHRIPLRILILPGAAHHRHLRPHRRHTPVNPEEAYSVIHPVMLPFAAAVQHHRHHDRLARAVQRARQVHPLRLPDHRGLELVPLRELVVDHRHGPEHELLDGQPGGEVAGGEEGLVAAAGDGVARGGVPEHRAGLGRVEAHELGEVVVGDDAV